MSKQDYSIIDTKSWAPIQSPGLRAEKHQLVYDDPQIQQVLSEAFSTMFPSIVETEAKQKSYQSINSGGRDVFPKAQPAKNISDVPRAEMMRLMEGWIRLRRKLQEEVHPDNVTAILLNFRVPNPRQSLDRYMLYKKGDETRLIIRWGYETKEAKAVSLERAISILMDVPLGHMRSILSTTMSATTSTVPVGPLLAAAEQREKYEVKTKGNSQNKIMLAAAVVIICLLSVAVFNGFKVGKDKSTDDLVVTEVAVGKTTAEVNTAPVEVMEIAVERHADSAEVKAVNTVAITEIVADAKKPDMNSLMDDLVMNANVKKEGDKQLDINSMLNGEELQEAPQKDLLGEMMH